MTDEIGPVCFKSAHQLYQLLLLCYQSSKVPDLNLGKEWQVRSWDNSIDAIIQSSFDQSLTRLGHDPAHEWPGDIPYDLLRIRRRWGNRSL